MIKFIRPKRSGAFSDVIVPVVTIRYGSAAYKDLPQNRFEF